MFDLESWPWQPELCSADKDFIDWLNEREELANELSPVFHMGPGSHHAVGIACAQQGIVCTAVTASEEEFLISKAVDLPGYNVILSDINKLDTELLSEFKIMTLFHIGEMEDRFGPVNYDVVLSLVKKVVPGGRVFFYKKSSAWDRTQKVFEQLLLSDVLHYEYDYQNLIVSITCPKYS